MLRKTVQVLLILTSQLYSGWTFDNFATEYKPGNPYDVLINSSPFVKVDKSYYYFSTQSVNWFAAFENCRKMGSELVTFETPEEFDALLKYLLNQRMAENRIHTYWTSGTDLGLYAIFKWFSNGGTIKTNRWAKGQPDNYQGKEHCVAIGYDDQNLMHDARCECLKKYICEAPKQETITIVVWK